MPLHRIATLVAAFAAALALAGPATAEEANLPLAPPDLGETLDDALLDDDAPLADDLLEDDLLDEPEPEADPLPVFTPGFLRRVHQVSAQVDRSKPAALLVTITRFVKLPARFGEEAAELVDQSAEVVVPRKAKTYGKACRKKVRRAKVMAAKKVRIHGKLLAPSAWEVGADGVAVPRIQAKKVCLA